MTLAAYKKKGIELSNLLKIVSQKMNVSEELILKQSRRTKQVEARKVFCYACRLLGFPTRKVGEFLGIQQAAVSHASRKGELIVKQYDIKII